MGPEQVDIWIPFLAIPLGIGMIITLMVLLHRAKIRELDQRHRERMAAIEKGLDPSSMSGPETHERPRLARSWASDRPPPAHLLRGLIWLGVGLAYVLSAGEARFSWPGLPGWIAAGIGGAYVVYYVMEGRRRPLPPPSAPERPPGSDRGPDLPSA